MSISLLLGDCLEQMAKLPDCSIDAIVTDPPYGLSNHRGDEVAACLQAWLSGEVYQPKGKGFMGKAWDAWVPGPEVWREALRVLKPGGHILAFAGTRSMDLMSMAIRLAGFELRDSIGWVNDGGGAPLVAWCYGSGFPKSADVSKQIDKAAGAEREVVGSKFGRPGYSLADNGRTNEVYGNLHDPASECAITAPATPEAQQWQGWGTALKPAWEPCILARKPFKGTVAANVLAHGTGGLNVDGCRVAMGDEYDPTKIQRQQKSDGAVQFGSSGLIGKEIATYKEGGRWPANLILTYPEDEYKLRDNITPQQLAKLAEWMNENA